MYKKGMLLAILLLLSSCTSAAVPEREIVLFQADTTEITSAAGAAPEMTAVPETSTMPETTAVPDRSIPAESTVETTEITYVLNTNSKKFHRPDCKSVGQIKPENRQDVYCDRDEVLAQGYAPCKNCNP